MAKLNRTRAEFIERWKRHLAGLALFGVVSEIKDGPMARAARWMDIPAEVEKLLGQLYDDLKPKDMPMRISGGNGVKAP